MSVPIEHTFIIVTGINVSANNSIVKHLLRQCFSDNNRVKSFRLLFAKVSYNVLRHNND